MSFTIESIKYFNQLRNGDDFTLNPSDYTAIFKANAGEQIQVTTVFTYSANFGFNPTTSETLTISAGFGGNFNLSFSFTDWSSTNYRVGDTIDVYDNSGASIVANGVIQTLSSTTISITGTATVGAYTDGIVRDLTPIYNFDFEFKTQADTGSRTDFDLFDSRQIYRNATDVGAGGSRSTTPVLFVPRNPQNGDSGSFTMAYVDNPDAYTQRFEINHIFVVTPFHLEGYVYSPLTLPETYRNGTLAYLFDLKNLESSFINPREVCSLDTTGSVGWFNENFDGGINDYSLTSISYFDVDNAEAINQINTRVTTRVTAVIGGNFTTAKPVIITQGKLPTQSEYQSQDGDFGSIWVYETLLNDIDSAFTDGTIIQNYTITLNSPTQITVEFDVIYTGNEEITDGDDYVLFLGLEDDSLSANATNRTNLFLDSQTYLKSNDDSSLFEVTSFEVYDHTTDLGAGGYSDYKGFVEDGVLVDFQFTMKPQDTSSERMSQLWLNLVGFNSVENAYFNIQQNEISLNSRMSLDGSFSYQTFDVDTIRGFNLAEDDQFNIFKFEYLSNDGTLATYRVLCGVKINWQESLQILRSNSSGNRFEDIYAKEFNDGFNINNAVIEDFYNDALPLNGLNQNSSNYVATDWSPKFAIISKCLNDNQEDESVFYEFSPDIEVYNYDTNSNYTGSIVTEDANSVDLDGGILEGEDTYIIATFNDGNTKTDINDFEGVVRIEVENQTGFDIYEISSLRGTFEGNILKNVSKTIVGGNYTLSAEIDYTKLNNSNYKISARLFDTQLCTYKYTSFDGLNEFVNLGNVFNFEYIDPFSFTGWFNFNDVTTVQVILSKFNLSAVRGVRVYVLSGEIYFDRRNSNVPDITALIRTNTSPLTINTWHQISVTCSGGTSVSTMEIYVDGVVQGKTTIYNSLVNNTIVNTNDFQISGQDGTNLILDGFADKIVIYNKALTPAEITTSYSYGRGTGLIGIGDELSQYEMDELNPPDVIGSNNGTSVNQNASNIICEN